MDYLLERAVGTGMNGRSFGNHSYTDLVFANDVCLLAERMELLVPVLEALATEAESLGLEVNWQKTMATFWMYPFPHNVGASTAEEFVNLGALIHSSTHSSQTSQTECIHTNSNAEPLTSSPGGRESRCQLS